MISTFFVFFLIILCQLNGETIDIKWSLYSQIDSGCLLYEVGHFDTMATSVLSVAQIN